MSEFIKYQHVERYDKQNCQGLLDGECYIFPKIDGTNASIWTEDGDTTDLKAGSRKRELSLASDNAGFYDWAQGQYKILTFLKQNPDVRLYGEWLVPHTMKTYRDDAWRKFYVFDVMNCLDGEYLHYEEYSPMLRKHNIDYIPALCTVVNPTEERLLDIAKNNKYLIKDGEGIGEGIVIKRYDFVSKYGRVTWGKLVINEFKDKHMNQTRKITEKKAPEEQIVNRYVTKDLVEKELAKIMLDDPDIERKHLIPRILNTTFHSLVTEETWNFVQEHKRPVIDFKRLFFFCSAKVRESLPDLF